MGPNINSPKFSVINVIDAADHLIIFKNLVWQNQVPYYHAYMHLAYERMYI